MLRKIRIILAAVLFIGITWLFVDFTGTAHHWVGWTAKIQLLEALLAGSAAIVVALVVLTLIFGRIYCSVVCPLGILQDIFGWLGKKAKKNRYSFSKEKKWLRYPLLVLFIAAHMAGVGALFKLLAPYSTFGLIATNLLQPVWQAGNNVLAAVAEYYDSYVFYHSDIWLRSVASLVIAIAMLVVLAVLAWRNGRTWCNTVCPLGQSSDSLPNTHFSSRLSTPRNATRAACAVVTARLRASTQRSTKSTTAVVWPVSTASTVATVAPSVTSCAAWRKAMPKALTNQNANSCQSAHCF